MAFKTLASRLSEDKRLVGADHYWKSTSIPATVDQTDFYIGQVDEEDISTSIRLSLVGSSYKLEVTTSKLNSLDTIICHEGEEDKINDIVLDLLSKSKSKRCPGVSVHDLDFETASEDISSFLNSIVIKLHDHTAVTRVFSRGCKLFLTDGLQALCEACQPLKSKFDIKSEVVEMIFKTEESEDFLSTSMDIQDGEEEEDQPLLKKKKKKKNAVKVKVKKKKVNEKRVITEGCEGTKEDLPPINFPDKSNAWCIECSLKFPGLPYLRGHLKLKHGFDTSLDDSSPIKCLKCDHENEFESISLYTDHLIHYHDVPFNSFRYSCGSCLAVFLFRSHLSKHVGLNHREKVGVAHLPAPRSGTENRCSYCPRIFFSMYSLVSHMERLHYNENYTELPGVQEYYEYARNKHNKPKIKCPDCGKMYKRAFMKIHVLSHATYKKPCHVCGLELRPISFAKHVKQHEKEKLQPFLCSQCGKGFSTKEKLGLHMSNAHVPEAMQQKDGPFKCGQCDKSFNMEMRLRMHIYEHKGYPEGTLVCEVCGMTFRTPSVLKRHIDQLHRNVSGTVGDLLTCDMCPYTTDKWGSLKSHKKSTHQVYNMKPVRYKHTFRCDVCHKGYETQAKLDRHAGRHTREHVPCPLCTRSFVHKGNLRIHFKLHHNIDIAKGSEWNPDDYVGESKCEIVVTDDMIDV